MERYQRHINLSEIGIKGQKKLTAAKVLVIGAGGLGCPALQYLTAAGVGTIGIVDFDYVERSNLQRQILFPTESIGRNKAVVAKEVLTKLNPEIEIFAYPEQLNSNNTDLIKAYDIIVDATDNFSARYLISDASVVYKKPLVYGAIYKFEGQVSVFNYQNGPTYRCLFPNPPKAGSVPNCEQTGVLGVLPGIIGCLQANEVLKLILGIGTPLSGQLLCYHALNNKTSILSIKVNREQLTKTLKRETDFQLVEIDAYCDSVPEIELKDLNQDQIQLLDVREVDEQPQLIANNIINIPLGKLETQLNTLSKETKTIVFCKTNIRSKQAVSLMQKKGFNNCFSLREGASDLQEFLKNNQ